MLAFGRISEKAEVNKRTYEYKHPFLNTLQFEKKDGNMYTFCLHIYGIRVDG